MASSGWTSTSFRVVDDVSSTTARRSVERVEVVRRPEVTARPAQVAARAGVTRARRQPGIASEVVRDQMLAYPTKKAGNTGCGPDKTFRGSGASGSRRERAYERA